MDGVDVDALNARLAAGAAHSDKTFFFDLLGVAPGAPMQEVKRQFRKRARRLHPDKNPGKDIAELYSAMQRAYAVISDKEQRAMYAKYGIGGVEMFQTQQLEKEHKEEQQKAEDEAAARKGYPRPLWQRHPYARTPRTLCWTILALVWVVVPAFVGGPYIIASLVADDLAYTIGLGLFCWVCLFFLGSAAWVVQRRARDRRYNRKLSARRRELEAGEDASPEAKQEAAAKIKELPPVHALYHGPWHAMRGITAGHLLKGLLLLVGVMAVALRLDEWLLDDAVPAVAVLSPFIVVELFNFMVNAYGSRRATYEAKRKRMLKALAKLREGRLHSPVPFVRDLGLGYTGYMLHRWLRWCTRVVALAMLVLRLDDIASFSWWVISGVATLGLLLEVLVFTPLPAMHKLRVRSQASVVRFQRDQNPFRRARLMLYQQGEFEKEMRRRVLARYVLAVPLLVCAAILGVTLGVNDGEAERAQVLSGVYAYTVVIAACTAVGTLYLVFAAQKAADEASRRAARIAALRKRQEKARKQHARNSQIILCDGGAMPAPAAEATATGVDADADDAPSASVSRTAMSSGSYYESSSQDSEEEEDSEEVRRREAEYQRMRKEKIRKKREEIARRKAAQAAAEPVIVVAPPPSDATPQVVIPAPAPAVIVSPPPAAAAIALPPPPSPSSSSSSPVPVPAPRRRAVTPSTAGTSRISDRSGSDSYYSSSAYTSSSSDKPRPSLHQKAFGLDSAVRVGSQVPADFVLSAPYRYEQRVGGRDGIFVWYPSSESIHSSSF